MGADMSVPSVDTGADADLAGAESGLDRVNLGLKRFKAASIAAYAPLFEKLPDVRDIVTAIVDNAEAMMQKISAAESLGVDIAQYDLLSRTFEALGSNVEGFRESMTTLHQALGEAAKRSDSVAGKAFSSLGVSPVNQTGDVKTVDQAIPEIIAAMSKISSPQATASLADMGLTDNATVDIFIAGAESFQRQLALQKEFGVMTSQDAEAITHFIMALHELNVIVNRFNYQLTTAAVPALTLFLNAMLDVIKWGKEHEAFLLGFFTTLTASAIPAMIAALTGLTAAAWAAVAPFMPFIAVAMLVGLILEHLWTSFSGGESAIGKLVQQFPPLGAALSEAKNALAETWEMLKLLFTDPGAFLEQLAIAFHAGWSAIVEGMREAAGQLSSALVTALNQMAAEAEVIFITLWEFITGLFSRLGENISSAVRDVIDKAVGFLPDSVKAMLGIEIKTDEPPQFSLGKTDSEWFGSDPFWAMGQTSAAANHTLLSAAAMPAIPPPSYLAASAYSTRSVNVNRVEIHTQATDPQNIANGFADGLKNAYGELANHYDDGRGY